MAESRGFDPGRHLVNLKGKDYLEVKWRLVWLRDMHPDAEIATELIEHHPGQAAVVRAFVRVPNGGSATGYGSETKGDFHDYLEKAETKAIGRALGALGFGTQFCDDFEFGADAGRVVDTPVQRANGHAPRENAPQATTARQNGNAERPQITNPSAPASDSQINYIRGLGKQLGMVIVGPDGDDHADEVAIDARLGMEFDTSLGSMTKGDASAVIEAWKEEIRQAALAKR